MSENNNFLSNKRNTLTTFLNYSQIILQNICYLCREIKADKIISCSNDVTCKKKFHFECFLTYISVKLSSNINNLHEVGLCEKCYEVGFQEFERHLHMMTGTSLTEECNSNRNINNLNLNLNNFYLNVGCTESIGIVNHMVTNKNEDFVSKNIVNDQNRKLDLIPDRQKKETSINEKEKELKKELVKENDKNNKEYEKELTLLMNDLNISKINNQDVDLSNSHFDKVLKIVDFINTFLPSFSSQLSVNDYLEYIDKNFDVIVSRIINKYLSSNTTFMNCISYLTTTSLNIEERIHNKILSNDFNLYIIDFLIKYDYFEETFANQTILKMHIKQKILKKYMSVEGLSERIFKNTISEGIFYYKNLSSLSDMSLNDKVKTIDLILLVLYIVSDEFKNEIILKNKKEKEEIQDKNSVIRIIRMIEKEELFEDKENKASGIIKKKKDVSLLEKYYSSNKFLGKDPIGYKFFYINHISDGIFIKTKTTNEWKVMNFSKIYDFVRKIKKNNESQLVNLIKGVMFFEKYRESKQESISNQDFSNEEINKQMLISIFDYILDGIDLFTKYLTLFDKIWDDPDRQKDIKNTIFNIKNEILTENPYKIDKLPENLSIISNILTFLFIRFSNPYKARSESIDFSIINYEKENIIEINGVKFPKFDMNYGLTLSKFNIY